MSLTRIMDWASIHFYLRMGPWRVQEPIRLMIYNLFYTYFILPESARLEDSELIHDLTMSMKEKSDRNRGIILARGGVPLRLVVSWASAEIISAMLEKGAEVNAYDDWSRTPLHIALERRDRNLEIIKLLLKYGADPNHMDRYGYTPLHGLLQSNRAMKQTVLLLIKAGAEVRSMGKNWYKTPLLTAVRASHPMNIIKILVKAGANPLVERCSGNGDTVLHAASLNQRTDLIDYFLHLGLNVNTENNDNVNLITESVIETCDTAFLTFLFNRGAMVTPKIVHFMLNSEFRFKDAQSKFRMFLLYDESKTYKPRFSENPTMGMVHLGFSHGSFAWSIPLIEKIAFMDVLTNNINISELYYLNEVEELQMYFDMCKKECQRMKRDIFYNGITVFDLLAENVEKVGWFLCHRQISNAFMKSNYKMKYPTYSVYLEYTRCFVKELYKLERKCACLLTEVLLKTCMDDSSVMKIVRYLTPNEMRKFLSCFDDRS